MPPNHRLRRVVGIRYRFKPAFRRNWRVLSHNAPLSGRHSQSPANAKLGFDAENQSRMSGSGHKA